jgi:ATP-dependent protease ClpP protease subunit
VARKYVNPNYAAQGARSQSRSAYPMAVRIRSEAGGTRLDIFDDIGADGWGGGLSAGDFAGRLAGVKGPLTVGINSGGGDCFDGLAIYNALSSYPGPVTTVVDGLAASIASVIFQAGRTRVVSPGGMVMVHDAFSLCAGNEAEMTAAAATLGKVSDNLASVYAQRCGGTAQHWRDVMRAETWYTADEAVAAGLADRVGSGAAVLPAGLDLAARYSVPTRIAAALRSMPRAAADEADDGPLCKTCDGRGRLLHPVTGHKGKTCPSCGGSGTYDPGGGPGDSTDKGIFGQRLKEMRAAMPPLTTGGSR